MSLVDNYHLPEFSAASTHWNAFNKLIENPKKQTGVVDDSSSYILD